VHLSPLIPPSGSNAFDSTKVLMQLVSSGVIETQVWLRVLASPPATQSTIPHDFRLIREFSVCERRAGTFAWLTATSSTNSVRPKIAFVLCNVLFPTTLSLRSSLFVSRQDCKFCSHRILRLRQGSCCLRICSVQFKQRGGNQEARPSRCKRRFSCGHHSGIHEEQESYRAFAGATEGFWLFCLILKRTRHSFHFDFHTPACYERNSQWARECQRQRVFERFHRVSSVCFIICLMMAFLSRLV
jgi:hypothetical protein